MPVRVMICDDHPMFRRGLRALFDEVDDIEVVGEAEDGESALRIAAEHEPDVAVMDLRLPGISGLDVTQRLLAQRPGMGVLVLTMFEDDTSLLAALRAGARGYVVKGADHEEIVSAVLAIAHGEAILGRGVSTRLGAMLDTASGPRPFPELTDREFEVLQLVAHGLSNDDIAARLFLSGKTVRNNVSTILTKLGAASRAEAVARARDAGLPGRDP
jgi:DNA-binding NarL/FixJ family response regulator